MTQLTPSDVRNVAFKRASFGSRGYDEEEVDVFLDQVEKTIEALMQEVAALRGTATPGGLDGSGGFGGSGPAVAVAPVADLGQHRLMGELDQIKQRLARIEAAVNRGGATPRDPLFGG